jgi:inner membrane protein
LPGFFELINEEISGRRKGLQGRFAATLALAALVALWGLRDYEHRRALAALEARTYEKTDAIRVSAYPYWLSPFRWYAVVETRDFFAQTTVDSLTPEIDDGKLRIRFKPEETAVTLAAKKSYLGRVYLDWAQYPITETDPLESKSGYVVRFRDLRYEYPEREGAGSLSARVRLDQNLNVTGEAFGFRSRWGQPSDEK